MATYIFIALDDPLGGTQSSGQGTRAQDINDQGQIVGFYVDSSGATHGFLYSGGTYTTLDDPLGTGGTFAQGINDQGQIVGYYIDSSNTLHGFLYSGGTSSRSTIRRRAPALPAGLSAPLHLVSTTLARSLGLT